MKDTAPPLTDLALRVLDAAAPHAKSAAAARAFDALQKGAPMGELAQKPPNRPQRPDRPPLVPPGDVPKRRLGSEAGRAALLHAIAHIEFNAIDLAFDMAVRFAEETERLGLDVEAFISDWIGVGADEARHFGLVEDRLHALGSSYGQLPAHDGLWEAAEKTADNFLARLTVAPLILEARGLDVTPGMIKRFKAEGDEASAAVLEVIYRDEIGHVECGKRWFLAACEALHRPPAETFQALRAEYFAGVLKPPFNHEARAAAGLPRSFYDPI